VTFNSRVSPPPSQGGNGVAHTDFSDRAAHTNGSANGTHLNGTDRKISHTAAHPCPVCRGSDDDPRGQGRRCFGYTKGVWCNCTREDHAGNAQHNPTSNTYSHILKGPCPCGVEHAPTDATPKKRKGTIERIYSYRDVDGSIVHETVRYKNPKGFSQRRPDGKGGHIYKDVFKGITPILYRRSELLAADPAKLVFISEGEKDVENLYANGLIATTCAMGAKKWCDRYSDDLRGRSVVILPHNDSDGRLHADSVARSLQGKAISVKVVELPGLPEKGDVSDFLAAGGTVDQILEMVTMAPEWAPPATTGPASTEKLPRFARTDRGNAERLVHRHGRDFHYCFPWKKFLLWDGPRWKLDGKSQICRFAKETARSILDEAAAAGTDEEKKELVVWWKSSESKKLLDAMIALASSEQGIPIMPEDVNSNPMLLNCLNGTVDLETGRLRPHDRDDLILSLAPVNFDASATCPIWDKTLRKIFADKTDVITFWQRLCGLSLTGLVDEQVLPVLYGSGANGKSTILTVLLELMGTDYSLMAPPGLLMLKQGENHPTERACLYGKRLVVDVESAENARLNENLVKQLTGSDRIQARRMREDFWEFSPTHKLMLATNHRPKISETTHAIWRRIKLIPFTVTIPEEEQIKDLPKRLRAEYPGILAWCVRGCLDWKKNGLGVPDDVNNATADYRANEDVLGDFITNECTISSSLSAKASHLYKRYQSWTEGCGEKTLSQRAFGLALSERGFERYTNDGTRYRGIGLRDSGAHSSYQPY
jgi:putative DNA primase/helicase